MKKMTTGAMFHPFHPTVPGGCDPTGEDLYGDHGPVGLRWRAPVGRRGGSIVMGIALKIAGWLMNRFISMGKWDQKR